MSLFGPGVERKTQLFFRDDNSFVFVKRNLKFSCLVEMAGEKIVKAWKHFYGCQLPVAGYKNMSADMVTLGFARDIILDVFNKVPEGNDIMNKPNLRDKASMGKWIANIAENQRHFFRAKRESQVWTSRVTWALIAVLVIMVIFWGMAFARRIYA